MQEYTFDTSRKSISSSTSAHTIPAAQILAIDAIGELSIVGSFNIEGGFLMTLSGSSPNYTLNVAVDAHVNAFFGLSLDVVGAAQIDTSGDFAMAIAVNVSMGIPHIFTISGDAIVEVNSNSSSTTLTLPDQSTVTVAPGGRIHLDASIEFLSLVSISVGADASYNSITNDFTLCFSGSASINLFIFDATMNFGGWIDSSGQFAVGFHGSSSVDFGIGSVSGSFGIGLAWSRGPVTFDGTTGLPVQTSGGVISPISPISYTGTAGLTIQGEVNLSGHVLGIGASFSGSLNYSQSSGELSISTSITIDFFFFSISIGVTLDVGNLGGNQPPAVYLAGSPYAATVDPGSFGGGQLVLNVGNRASNRNFNNTDTNEIIVLTGDTWNASAGTQTIYVTIDGYSQAFTNVSKVTIPGTGANTIQIANSVHVPIYATGGGVGNNSTIIDAGSGNATLVGGTGNDVLEAGSGNVTMIGGGGNDTIVAGTGNDSVTTTGVGASQVLWNADQDGTLSLMGDNNGDELVVTTNTPGTVYAGGETINVASPLRGVSTISGTRGILATMQHVKNLVVNAPGGNNQIGIGDLNGSGITSLQLVYGQSHNAGNSLDVNGTPGNDTMTLSSGVGALPTLPTAPPPTATPAAAMASPMATIGGNNVQTVTIDNSNGLTITVLGTSAGAGDSLNLNSGGGTMTYNVESVVIPATLNGGTTTGSTTYYFIGAQPNNSAGTLSGINSTLNIDGTSSSDDILVLEDTADSASRTFDLTSTQAITDATGSGGKIFYNSGIDNLDLDAGPGKNSYVVKGTAASTLTQILTGNSDNNFVVNGPITDPLAIDGGSSLLGLNTLTVNGAPGVTAITVGPGLITGDGANIYYANMDGISINGGNTGTAFTLNGNLIPVTLLGGTGNDSFTLEGNSAPININSGAGIDAFTINGNSAPATITGSGSDSFNIESNSDRMTINAGAGQDVFNVDANTGTLTLNGGSGKSNFNTFNVFGNSGALFINSGGSSQYNIANVASPVVINGQSTASSYFITAPLPAPVTITGTATLQNLVLTATVGDDNIIITPTQILGAGAAINYSGFKSITINGNGGDDTIQIVGTSSAVIINAGNGNATVNVQSISAALTINNSNGTGNYTISNSGLLGGIAAPVTVNGTGNDTLTLDDSNDGLAQAGQITNTTIAGMGMGVGGFINYTGLALLNIALGNGVQTVAVASTNSTTPVNLTTGAGSDTINVQSINSALAINAGSGTNSINIGNAGILSGIQAAITVDGGGVATLTIDDHADATPNQFGALTGTSIIGFGMSGTGITYTNISNLNVLLGSGGTAVTVVGTSTASTQINGGNGGDNFLVDSTTGNLTIITGTGANAITAGELLSNIQGGLTVIGNGTTSLTLDNSADTTSETGTLNATQVQGLGMGSLGVTYAGVTSLDVNLGGGGNSFTVEQTGTATSINGGSGDDSIFVQQTNNATTIGVGTGTNSVTLGNPQINGGNLLSGLIGNITLIGGGTDSINLDDTANASPAIGIITATTITGLTPAVIDFSGDVTLANLNIALGDAGNTLTISDTPTTAGTHINAGDGNNAITIDTTSGRTVLFTGAGNSSVNVQATNAPTTIQTDGGTNSITVAGTGNTLAGVQGALNVLGSINDTLTLTNTGDALSRTGQLTATTVTGFGMGTSGVCYQNIGTLNLQLGSGGTTLSITDTNAATATNITGSTGNDSITMNDDSGATAITVGTGITNVTVLGTGAATTITGGNTTVGAGDLSNITGALTINSTGTLTVNDSAVASGTAFLTAAQLAGLSPAAIHYANQSSLTLDLPGGLLTIADTSTATTVNGSGASTVVINHNSNPTTINTTAGVSNWVDVATSGAPVTINSGAGAVDTIQLTNNGSMTGINGPVTVNGSGTDELTLDDSADAGNRTTTIDASSVTGLAPAVVTYNQLGTLNVLLGTGTETTTVANTSTGTITNLTGGAATNAFTVQNNAGDLHITGQGTHNTVAVQGTGALTTYVDSTGASANITVGNAGSVANVTGQLTITGRGSDTLAIDDTADTNSLNATISSTRLTGIAPAEIDYSNVANLAINLGSGGNDVTVAGTASNPTQLNTGSGDDSVAIQATTGALSLNTGNGNNSTNISGTDETTNAINGAVTLTGDHFDHLSIDDTGDVANHSPVLTSSSITGLSPAGINYTGVSALALSLGSGVNNSAITSNATATSITTGNGTVSVSNGGLLNTITAPLSIFGNGQTNLTINDANDSAAQNITLNADNITGFAPATIGYSQINALSLLLGSGSITTTITNTAAASTNMTGNAGNETFNINNSSNTLNIAGGNGANNYTVANSSGTLNIAGGNGNNNYTVANSSGALNITGGNGNNHYTVTNGSATATINGGNGNDSYTVANTSGALTIAGGVGVNSFNILNDSAPVTITGSGTHNTVQIHASGASTTYTGSTGSAANILISNSGSLTAINGIVNINGAGSDVLSVDDSADTVGRNVTLSSSNITGASPAAINYNGVSTLNLALGSGGNNVNIIGTSSGPTNLNTGTGNDGVLVASTTGALTLNTDAGNDSVLLAGNGGALLLNTGSGQNAVMVANLPAIQGAVAISGSGSDLLTVDGRNSIANESVSITSSAVGGLTNLPISYSGVSALNVLMDNAHNSATVVSTNAATLTTINPGTGSNTVAVGNGGWLNSIAGPLTVNGGGQTTLSLDDSADTSYVTEALAGDSFSGANAGLIRFNGLANLNLMLGSGGNNLAINNTIAGSTNINGNSGSDAFTIHQTTGATNLQTGAGTDAVAILNTTGPTSIATGSGNDAVSVAQNAGPVNIATGSGSNTVSITGSTSAIAIAAGMGPVQVNAGNDLGAMAGLLTVAGNGQTNLSLNDTASAIAKAATITSSTITGLNAGGIHFSGVANLGLQLAGDNITVGSSITNTAITGAAAVNVITTNGTAASINAPLAISGGSITINDSNDPAATNVLLTNAAVTGLGSTITYSNAAALSLKLGQSSDKLTVTSIADSTPTAIDGGSGQNSVALNFTGDYNGNLALTAFQGGSLAITGNDNGTISTDGSFNTVSIGGSIAPQASLAVTGNIAQLNLGGTDSGSITSGSTNGGLITNATPDANGLVFSVTAAGVTRSVYALSASGQPLVGVTFDLVYDATTLVPSIAVQVNNTDAAHNRFDLVLNSTAGGMINLASLTCSDATAGIRNIAVNGSILGTGIVLPSDHLAAVSVSGLLPARSIDAASIQALSFGTMTGLRGVVSVAQLNFTTRAFPYALALNPATNLPYATLAPVTEPLRLIAGENGTVGLYEVAANGKFDTRGLLVSAGANPILGTVNFATDARRREYVSSLTLDGDGGSISTNVIVKALVSNGALNNVNLGAGKSQLLDSLSATSITGNVDLHGGTLTGTMQTTGIRNDLFTGTNVDASADLGSVQNGHATSLKLAMAPTASIVSRGDLLSSVQLSSALNGTIAAGGNIGTALVGSTGNLTRFGGISSSGTAGGQIIALGNILGDVSIKGKLTGQIAARGETIPNVGSDRTGILGQLTIKGTVSKGAGIISGGEIGDASGGTKLTTGKVAGEVMANGLINGNNPGKGKPPTVGGANPAAAWLVNGNQLNGFSADLSDLATVKQQLKMVSGG